MLAGVACPCLVLTLQFNVSEMDECWLKDNVGTARSVTLNLHCMHQYFMYKSCTEKPRVNTAEFQFKRFFSKQIFI